MKEKSYWLGWSVFPGVGPGKFKRLLDHFKSAKEAWESTQLDLKNVIGEKLATDFEEFRKTFSIENYLKKLEEKDVWFLTQKDPEYPQLLLKIDRAPIVLYGKGNFIGGSTGRLTHISNDAQRALGESLNSMPSSLSESRLPRVNKNTKNKTEPTFSSFEIHDQSPIAFDTRDTFDTLDALTVAVVGTRKITSYGREVTEILTRELVQNGFVIISGLAMGVDAVAHKTAIEEGGKTIAVLGCGVDLCYPSSNKKLYDEIINGDGAVVSEFPVGMTPSVGSFPSRNRIIAGLSSGVLVTEGAEDSGSLITADYAFKYQRKVFAVPGQITSGLSRGPSKLIQKGAKLVTNVDDILQDFKFEIRNSKFETPQEHLPLRGGANSKYSPRGEAGKIPKDITKEEKKILSILQNEPLQFDEIVRIANLDSSKVGTLLTLMEIKGMLKSLESGFFSIVN